MTRALHSRRRVLRTGGAALLAGLAGCTDSSRTDEAPAEDDAQNGTTGGGMEEPDDEEERDEGLGRGDDESGDEEQGTTNATVTVGPGGELAFDPETVEIQQGETVRWEWESNDHTVTPDATPEDADWEGEPEEQQSGYTYEHTFETAGTYEYYCAVHPDAMTGAVVVDSGDEESGDGGGAGEDGGSGENETSGEE